MELLGAIGLGIVLFASTNIDDLFVLLSFFSDPSFHTRQIIIGQYIGIGALVLISIIGSLLSLILSPEYIGLLGLLPILIGLKKLCDLRSVTDVNEEIEHSSVGLGKIMAVTGVTMANGGDNIGIYTPIFATSNVSAIVTIIFVFILMVSVWLFLSHWLVNNPSLGAPIRRYGHIVTPFVLIVLGLFILYEANSFSLVI